MLYSYYRVTKKYVEPNFDLIIVSMIHDADAGRVFGYNILLYPGRYNDTNDNSTHIRG